MKTVIIYFLYLIYFVKGLVLNRAIVPVGYIRFKYENPGSVFCKKRTQQDFISTSDLYISLKQAFFTMKKSFIYKKEASEKWNSYLADILAGNSIEGDCDDWALTCAELLYTLGMPLHMIKIAFCKTEFNDYHLTCIAAGLLLDNRQKEPLLVNSINYYTWVSFMSLDEPGIWRKGFKTEIDDYWSIRFKKLIDDSKKENTYGI